MKPVKISFNIFKDENEEEDEEMKPEDLDKVKKALGEHADAENSDIDMDDIPDEDMDNLDKKLVEAFKVHNTHFVY